MLNVSELVERLVAVPGPSGFEDAVAIAIQKEIEDLPGEVTVDGLGNLVVRMPGATAGGPSLMFMAHMDQVGLLVKYIDDDGMLYCEPNGLVDERSLAATQVQVWTDEGARVGVVGVRSRHLMSERDLAAPTVIGEQWVHVGASSADGAAAMGIRIGQPVTFRGELVRLSEHMLLGPSIDNRAGCAALVALAHLAANASRDFDLVLVWSTQEEVGSRGAQVAARWNEPTAAVVVDTLPAGDPSTPARQATSRVGAGPVIRAQDSRAGKGTIYSQAVRRRLLAQADALSIPYQADVFQTWTDACEVHLQGRGVPTGGVFIPRLCSHTPNELLDVRDLEQTIALLAAFADLDARTLESLAIRPSFPLGRLDEVAAEFAS